ncbi:hypothetical protein NOK91_25755, partial [Vibrio parahaemolyticus]|uniref:hypothetical protein n=1 Tax=Vibrio parahaemolyticus TaxID=670 RepID=UPI00226B81CE
SLPICIRTTNHIDIPFLFANEAHNAALRCEQRLAILERSESAKRCESLLNALLCAYYLAVHFP